MELYYLGDKMDNEEKRDKIHERIKDLKEKRNLTNQEIESIAKSLNSIRDEHFKSEYRRINNLNKKIKDLEKEQMTSVLSLQEEKNIVKKLSEASKEREKIHEKINEIKSIGEHQEKIKELRIIADDYHFLILKLSEKGTEYHNKMKEED